MHRYDVDVAVLGSGFGGCLSALVLDRLGFRTVVLDRAIHPRFAIGESSTPIADMILRDLSERYDLPRLTPLSAHGPWREHYPQLGVGRKRGFSYFHHRLDAPFSPDPEHGNELLVAASSDPYFSDTHWLRADVDAFLAGEVRAAGIPLLDATEVHAEPVAAGWRLAGTRRDEPVAVTARFALDATGAGVLAAASGAAGPAPALHTHSRALYAHFTGVTPWQELYAAAGGCTADHPFPCDEAALHHVFDGGWMWMLRFDHGLVSAGFLLDPRRHPLDPGVPPAEEWEAWLERLPSVRRQFAAAGIADPPGALIRTGRLQRRVARAAGATWALLPSSAGFVDPLHSTGIAHTLSGIERLALLLEEHWDGPGLAPRLEAYGRAVLRELDLVDRLVAACYESAASFERYAATARLYFAAVITYEQARLRGEGTRRSFLGADDDRLFEAVDRARDALASPPRRTPDDVGTAPAYRTLVEELIAPYDPVGLFRSPRPNMIPHTGGRVRL